MHFKTETKVGIFILLSLCAFGYMTFYLGIFKVNLSKYNSYNIYFKDLSGIVKKSDVKISGVKVGWVDSITLVDGGLRARIKILVNKSLVLHSDSCAEIKQDGLLGSRYLELFPGSNMAGSLPNGATLYREGRSVTSMEDLLRKVKSIAENVEVVTESLKNVIGSSDQQDELKLLIANISKAADRISSVSEVISKNGSNVDSMIKNLTEFSSKLDKTFSSLVEKIDTVTGHVGSVAEKIDNGEGLLGKIINDDKVYDDIQAVASVLRTTADAAANAELVVDSHWETMYRPAEFFFTEDSKGYLEMRMFTSEDKFYIMQLVSTLKGNLIRDTAYYRYFNSDGQLLSERDLGELPVSYKINPAEVRKLNRKPDAYKFSLQIGKSFGDIALRFGLIESFAGVGLDYEIPFKSDKFRWVSTFEGFDFRGQDRIDDLRPHLKWINRIFILRNIYINFGADDFISRRNANAFFGGGIRFNDDDLKTMLMSMGSLVTGFIK